MMQKLNRMAWVSALLLGTLATTACVNVPYRAPIQQGNVVEANRVGLIKEGMSKAQIANAVGTPILEDVFHQDRWDFIYRLDEHYQPVEQKRITVWFNKDIATKVERSDTKQ